MIKTLTAWGVFFALLITATAVTLHNRQKQLPVVRLGVAQSGELPNMEGNRQFDCIIPKEAVYQEPSGPPFVLLVRQQDGVWGNEFVCTKKTVRISEQSSTHFALDGPAGLQYPIVIESDRPVYDGGVVLLEA
jgi:hypothetical protein